jgi:hypothetical protein
MMRGRQPPTHYSVHGSPVRNVATSLQLGAKKWPKMKRQDLWEAEVETSGTAGACTPSQHYNAG